MDIDSLKAPFPADKVSWRVGSTNADKTRGLALAYIDARDVMERLDDVCGPARWQCTYPHANGKTVCSIGVKVNDEWIWKSNGAGDTDVEAEKGAMSDAFKRAAVLWGIGRYLYDLPSPWVALKQAGRSYAIADGEYANLRKLLDREAPSPRAHSQPSQEFTMAIDAMRKQKTRAALRDWYAGQKDVLREIFSESERTQFVNDYTAYGQSLPKEERQAA